MANDFLPFGTSGTANVYTNAEYVADTDHTNGNQPGIAKSKLVNKALRQCSIISTVVAQFISDITGTNSVDDGTTTTLLTDLKLATKGRIGTPIASAATTAIGGDAAGDVIHITGTTTITSLGTSTTGTKRVLIFDGALTLTHNIASLILPGAANIVTISGAVGVFVCENGALGYWKCIGYTDDITNKASLKTYFDTLYSPAGSAGSKIQPITASVAANALTVTLNPTSLDFRSATLGDGTVTNITTLVPTSMTVSSGSTLGTVNGIAARLMVISINNAGTLELAIVNLSGGLNLDETTLISTTAESGAGGADAINVIYSTTARANVPFRVVGFIDITEATAGTWLTAPSTIQGAGGEALKSINQLKLEISIPTTAGTSIDRTGIPSWAKRITLMFRGVSTNGANHPLIQLGSGAIVTTGYIATSSFISTAAATVSSTAGFIMYDNGATNTASGHMVLTLDSHDNWVSSHTIKGGVGFSSMGGGDLSLAGVLDRIRLTTVGGTDTFDAGSLNMIIEG